jgi:hypothetical protein
MKACRLRGSRAIGLGLTFILLTVTAVAQPGGFGPPGGPGGGRTRELVKQFDKDGDGRLDATERKAARVAAKAGGRPGGFGGGRGGPPGGGRGGPTPSPGAKVEVAAVKTYPGQPLYAPDVLRTLFLTFEGSDWESELEDFHNTDVEVPCTVVADGKTYPGVGVHFRGMSSYGMVRAGSKRSLNLSLDAVDSKQRLDGSKTLNLLNMHEDPTFLSTVLYSHVARQYIPAPKANLVQVVINGESWGVYTNVQQFDKKFLQENYKTTKGTRWKVGGSPNGRGGMEYLGDDIAGYKRVYEIKSKDDDKAWKALIHFCKVLDETPPDKLQAALEPICDVDNLLWFLALDVALINGDGFWTRASDYSIYLDPKGKFHFVPHDMNEAFHPAGGPGGPGGRGGPGGGRGFPAPGAILPPFVQDFLELTPVQKKELDALQKEADAQLDALLTPEQRKQWQAMRAGGPPGGPGGPGGGPGGPPGGGRADGVELDPLVGLTDRSKPLRSKVLAVPALRAKYLADIKTIAEKSLAWEALGPVVAGYVNLAGAAIEADTKKLETAEAFRRTTALDATTATGREWPLRAFADQRRKYLLDYKESTAR